MSHEMYNSRYLVICFVEVFGDKWLSMCIIWINYSLQSMLPTTPGFIHVTVCIIIDCVVISFLSTEIQLRLFGFISFQPKFTKGVSVSRICQYQ